MKTKIVTGPQFARILLKKGYEIVDLKPRKENKKETLFVFKVEGCFENDLLTLSKK